MNNSENLINNNNNNNITNGGEMIQGKSTDIVSVEYGPLESSLYELSNAVLNINLYDNSGKVTTLLENTNTAIPVGLLSVQESLFGISSSLSGKLYSDCNAMTSLLQNYQNLDSYLENNASLLNDNIGSLSTSEFTLNSSTSSNDTNNLDMLDTSLDYQKMNLSLGDLSIALSSLTTNFENDNVVADKEINAINKVKDDISKNQGRVFDFLNKRLDNYESLCNKRKECNSQLEQSFNKEITEIENYMEPYDSLNGADVELLIETIQECKNLIESCNYIMNAMIRVKDVQEDGSISFSQEYKYSDGERTAAQKLISVCQEKIAEMLEHIAKIEGLPAVIKKCIQSINEFVNGINSSYGEQVNNINSLPSVYSGKGNIRRTVNMSINKNFLMSKFLSSSGLFYHNGYLNNSSGFNLAFQNRLGTSLINGVLDNQNWSFIKNKVINPTESTTRIIYWTGDNGSTYLAKTLGRGYLGYTFGGTVDFVASNRNTEFYGAATHESDFSDLGLEKGNYVNAFVDWSAGAGKCLDGAYEYYTNNDGNKGSSLSEPGFVLNLDGTATFSSTSENGRYKYGQEIAELGNMGIPFITVQNQGTRNHQAVIDSVTSQNGNATMYVIETEGLSHTNSPAEFNNNGVLEILTTGEGLVSPSDEVKYVSIKRITADENGQEIVQTYEGGINSFLKDVYYSTTGGGGLEYLDSCFS